MSRALVLKFPPSAEPVAADDPRLLSAAAAALGLAPAALASVRARRISFDARARQRSWRVEVEAWLAHEAPPPGPATEPPTFAVPAADAPHVVVVGSGPAGTFAALDLLARGVRVSVLERGDDVQRRRRRLAELQRGEPADPDCNYCFGEGGAGTYSDGKLYTRAGDKRAVRAVLELLVAHGAPVEILSSWRPHVGSNRLPVVVAALRATILRSGGSVRFGVRAERIETRALALARPAVAAVHARVVESGELLTLACDGVVLATGHSALDALRMAQKAGVALEPKGFAMGVRAEHPQPFVDERQYGGLRGRCDLPAAFYELTARSLESGVYSFCMCPGGFIVPAMTAPERVVVNGMSLSRRDSPFASSGVVVALDPEDWCGERGATWGWPALLERAAALGCALPDDAARGRLPREPRADPLFGVWLQRALETVAAKAGGGRNRAPAQRIDRFVAGGEAGEALATSYRPGVRACELALVLPAGMTQRLREGLRAFDARLPGYASSIGQLVGVESRTSSPVRLARDKESCESAVAGLYPCGEGAGYAGGIVSAALDGRRVAAALAAALARG